MSTCAHRNCTRPKRCNQCRQCWMHCRCACSVQHCPNRRACDTFARCANHCRCSPIPNQPREYVEQLVRNWAKNRSQLVTRNLELSTLHENFDYDLEYGKEHRDWEIAKDMKLPAIRLESMQFRSCLLGSHGIAGRWLESGDVRIISGINIDASADRAYVMGNNSVDTIIDQPRECTTSHQVVFVPPITPWLSQNEVSVQGFKLHDVDVGGKKYSANVVATGVGLEEMVVRRGQVCICVDVPACVNIFEPEMAGTVPNSVLATRGIRDLCDYSCVGKRYYDSEHRVNLILDQVDVDFCEGQMLKVELSSCYDGKTQVERGVGFSQARIVESGTRIEPARNDGVYIVVNTTQLQEMPGPVIQELNERWYTRVAKQVAMALRCLTSPIRLKDLARISRTSVSDVSGIVMETKLFGVKPGTGCYLTLNRREAGRYTLEMAPEKVVNMLGITILPGSDPGIYYDKRGHRYGLVTRTNGICHLTNEPKDGEALMKAVGPETRMNGVSTVGTPIEMGARESKEDIRIPFALKGDVISERTPTGRLPN